MNNDINALREELFATMRALRDPNNPMDPQRAKVIAEVGQTIINSAKAEVDFINAAGRAKVTPSGFIGGPPRDTLDEQDSRGAAAIEHKPGDKPADLPYVGTPVRGALRGSM